jgi:excinuclease UvrABC nuclease subunit
MAGNWTEIDLWDIHYEFPSGPGCYAVFAVYNDGTQILYIGSAENLKTRLENGHRIELCRYRDFCKTPWGVFKHIVVKCRVSKRYGDWLMIEARLIRRLQPPGNTRGIKYRVKEHHLAEKFQKARKKLERKRRRRNGLAH